MAAYKREQWQFLLENDAVSADIAVDENDPSVILGCILRIAMGGCNAAFGMMLVSPAARGQGLARKLLTRAMGEGNEGLRILGVCTEMGRPMYEKMGFARVGTVTKLDLPCEVALGGSGGSEDVAVTLNGAGDEQVLLELDRDATGLDRTETLISLLAARMSGLKTTTAVAHDSVTGRPVGAAAARRDGSSLVVGPLLGDERAALPLIQALRASAIDADRVTILVSDHQQLVERFQEAGFSVTFELGAMTLGGAPLPGNRDAYLGLIHPTLG